MEEVHDVKHSPFVPPAVDAQPAAPCAPTDMWCCSSCSTACEGVPCAETLWICLKDAWNAILGCIYSLFGWGDFNIANAEAFYNHWSARELILQGEDGYAEFQTAWEAAVDTLPAELQEQLLRAAKKRSNPGDGKVAADYTVDEIQDQWDTLSQPALYMIITVGKWIDQKRTEGLDIGARIDYFVGLWTNTVAAEGTARVCMLARWTQHINSLEILTVPASACAYGRVAKECADQIKWPVVRSAPNTPWASLSDGERHAVTEYVRKNPGCPAFVNGINIYKMEEMH